MCIQRATNDSTLLWRRHLLPGATAAADTITRLEFGEGNLQSVNAFDSNFGLELPHTAIRNATNERARPLPPDGDANFTTPAAASLSQSPNRSGRHRRRNSLAHYASDGDYLDVRLYQQLRDWIWRQISKIRTYHQMIPRSIFKSAQAHEATSEVVNFRPQRLHASEWSSGESVPVDQQISRLFANIECTNKGFCKWTYLFNVILLISHLVIAFKLMFDFDLPLVFADQAKSFLGSHSSTVADTPSSVIDDYNQASRSVKLLQINLMISSQQHNQLKSATSYSDSSDSVDTSHELKLHQTDGHQVEVARGEGREYLHGQGGAWIGMAAVFFASLFNATNIFHYLLIVALVDFFSKLKWHCALLQSQQYGQLNSNVRSSSERRVASVEREVHGDNDDDDDVEERNILVPVRREFTQITLDRTHDDDGDDDNDDNVNYCARGHTSWLTAGTIMRLLLSSRHLFQFVQVGLLAPLLHGGGQPPVSSLILLMSFLNHLNQSARFALYLCKLHRHGHNHSHSHTQHNLHHHHHHNHRTSLFDVAHKDVIGHDRVANYKFNYLPLISTRLDFEGILSKFEKYLIMSRILHLQLTMLTLTIQLDSLPSGCSMRLMFLAFCTIESLRALYLQCEKYYSIKQVQIRDK